MFPRFTLSREMYGARFWNEPELQNWPMLSVVNEMATSGGVPPRIDWVILSSSWLPTFLIVMLGCALWNSSITAPRPFSSRSAKLLQTVSVTFWSAAGAGAAADVDEPVPEQAVRLASAASPATTAIVAFFIEGLSRLVV